MLCKTPGDSFLFFTTPIKADALIFIISTMCVQ
jgi:hypothetical protein